MKINPIKHIKSIKKKKADEQEGSLDTGISEPDDFKVNEASNVSKEADIDQKEIIAEVEKEEDPKKEYTSDSVFGKLNELKESE